MASEQVFFHDQYGPYQQRAIVKVKDGGNGLPIHLGMETGDPPSQTSNSMSISQAKRYRDALNKGIEAAEEAGIKDAGF
jgi:hypothetical protein